MPRAIWTGAISFWLVNVPARMYSAVSEHDLRFNYALLRTAMQKSGLAAIARYVMRDRQHLGCLRVRNDVIVLEKMYFADEIRPDEELAPREVEVDRGELELAGELIDRFAGSVEPERYHDTYRDTLCEIIEAKRKGEEVHASRRPSPRSRPISWRPCARASRTFSVGAGAGRRGSATATAISGR